MIGRAGFALSPSCLADVIISYYIENGVHDIFEINAALFSFGQPCIGGKGSKGCPPVNPLGMLL